MRQHHKKPFFEVWMREWRRIALRWPFLFVTIVGPILSFFLLSWIFQAGVPRELPVAIVDMDNTSMSRQIARYTDATPIAAIDRNFISLTEAQRAMESGDVDAVLYIPKDMEKKILRGESSQVALYINNANVVRGGVLNSGIRKALGTVSAGIKLRSQLQKGMIQEQAVARIMPVTVRSEILFNPYTSYSYYLTAGFMPALLVVFTLLGTIYALGTELLRGTGPRLMNAADGNYTIALFGKILPYTLIYFCLAMFMNILLFQKLGLPLHGNFLYILLGEFMLIVSYQFMAIFLVGVLGNLRLALSIGGAYSMLGLSFSGLTFPAIGMPAFSVAFSSIFPYTYWLKVLIGQSLRSETAYSAFVAMLSMATFISLGLLLIRRYRFLLVTPEKWGKE